MAAQAILDAIAAGILLYNGVVDLFSPHFSSLHYHNSSFWIKTMDISAVWIGCAIMTVIGIWA